MPLGFDTAAVELVLPDTLAVTAPVEQPLIRKATIAREKTRLITLLVT
jgi:hypothetical protein